ncbi:hypothetical protein DFJ73DRAFT_39221 [Zopfochytrium polystomum]|nr:hypothetical protein DFJ73DRAFT_39221 [Zopfochytrium polystomum]
MRQDACKDVLRFCFYEGELSEEKESGGIDKSKQIAMHRHHQLLFRLPDDVIFAICGLLTFLDLTRLSCCSSLARSVVGRRFVRPLLIDPLLRIALMSATKDCLQERPKDRFYESRSPFFFSTMVAIRSYIDLSHTFDLHHKASKEDHDITILQSIPLLFPIDSILRSPARHLDKLSAQALNSSIKVGQSLWLRPFEMRLEFWKGLIDRAYDGDGNSDHDYLMNSLTSSFESDQALEALQYLETYVKTHLGTLVERCKTISIPVENESDRESELEEEREDLSLQLPRLLVTAILALLPALSADRVSQAWELLNVLEFTVKTKCSEPTGRPICTSPDWIQFWKQIVVREMDPNNCGKQPVWLWWYFDSDEVMELAVDTMLQTISEIEIDKSDVTAYKAFIQRQLKLLHSLCLYANVNLIGEQAPKLIAILADIVRTKSFEESSYMYSCLKSLDFRLLELSYHYVEPSSEEFKSNVDLLVDCYSNHQTPYSSALNYLPICGGDDCHLKYVRSAIEINWNIYTGDLCRNVSGQRHHSMFLLAIELEHFDLLYNLANNKSELRLHHIEKCIPIVLSKLNKEEGLLNAILKFLPNYSVKNSVDSALHNTCFCELSNILAQRGFLEHIQPLIKFLFRNIDHNWSFASEVVENVLMTVIQHLSSITLSDMVAVWNRIQRWLSLSTKNLHQLKIWNVCCLKILNKVSGDFIPLLR